MAENADLITAVARLYYLQGQGQTEIASLFGISRSTVSRMLTSARERGIVRISVDDFDPRDRELEAGLVERFGLRRAIVVRGVGTDIASVRRTVGYFAAEEVADWLSGAQDIGVTGGRTLGEVVRALPHEIPGRGSRVVQLMGTMASAPGHNEGSELGRVLAGRLQGVFHSLNSPAYVENAQMEANLMAHRQFRDLWTMFGRVSLAFTGIGSVENSMFIDHQVLSGEMISQLRDAGAVAEMCGRFLDADGREVGQVTSERVIGASIETLQGIEDVVAVTSGAERGEAVRAVLASGVANSIVTDDACAREVMADDSRGQSVYMRAS